MNCESCEEPKNSFTAAATGFALIISWGMSGSLSAIVRRSFTARSTRTRPTRKAFSAIRPPSDAPVAEMIDVVDRPLPFLMSMRTLSTSRMSSFERTPEPEDLLAADAAVEITADAREVVALAG